MKGRDEIVVGATMLFALAVVVLGVIWMSQVRVGQAGLIRSARFRTVGGLGVGNPVVLRGVRVGRVQAIELGEGEWVLARLEIYPDHVDELPELPAVIAASASLFGEWQAGIVSFDEDLGDPNVRRELNTAAAAGDESWPGATLPDIGQLTAQAGRIATDIASFSARIEKAFDDQVVDNLQQSIRHFTETANQINTFAGDQTVVLGEVAQDVRETSGAMSTTAQALERTMSRIDSATAGGRLDSIMANSTAITEELRAALEGVQEVVSAISARQGSIDRIMGGADSVFTRLQEGEGTIGRLVGDSTLYVETYKAIAELRSLIADIKQNPRKYFKFSVF
jgi:phospholipid/cholesterol/gamma-HCH transport system substrate-binding protein